jgi:uncharacterized protein
MRKIFRKYRGELQKNLGSSFGKNSQNASLRLAGTGQAHVGQVLPLYLHCVNTVYALQSDKEKDRRNVIRHGIAFEDAARIFDGPTVEKVDDRFDYDESRVYAIGLVDGLEITVVYADENDEERRIISAWRAEPHERRSYWQNIEG